MPGREHDGVVRGIRIQIGINLVDKVMNPFTVGSPCTHEDSTLPQQTASQADDLVVSHATGVKGQQTQEVATAKTQVIGNLVKTRHVEHEQLTPILVRGNPFRLHHSCSTGQRPPPIRFFAFFHPLAAYTT